MKIIGFLLIFQLLFFRLKDKVPRDINNLYFIIVLFITIIYLGLFMLLLYKIISNKYKRVEKSNENIIFFNSYFIKPINDFIKNSYIIMDFYIKDELLGPKILGKTLNSLMLFFIEKIGVYYKPYNKAFILFNVLPKVLLLLLLFVDLVMYKQLKFVYNFAWIPLVPLIFQYFVFTLREFTEFNIKGILNDYIQLKSLDPEYFFSSQDIIDECCDLYRENIFDLCTQEYLNRDFAIPLHVGRAYILKEVVIDMYSNNEEIESAFDKILNHLNEFRILRQIIYNIDKCKMHWYYLYLDLFRFLSYSLIWFYVCTFHVNSILNFFLLMIFFESPF